MPRAARLLVLDGVPQSDPFGGWVNWPAYDPADLAEVRVVRGGGSVGNGPGALAGTIEMISRSDPGMSGEIDGGSRDSLEARGRVRGARGGRRAERFRPRRARRRVHADQRATRAGRPTSPRLIASGAAARAGSRRSAATPRSRRASTASTTGARAAWISAPTAPMAPTPRCGWSAAERGSGARSAIGSGATS